jgi:two-component system response regulator HydG
MSQPPRLCLIEDDVLMGESLCDRFALEGIAFDWHRDGASALRSIEREPYAAIISDVRLPDVDGEELLRRLLARHGAPLPPFLFITAYGSIDRAVEALKLGAVDYITKPFDIEQLIDKTRRLIGSWRALPKEAGGEAVLGVSPVMRRVEEMLPRIAQQADTVLITGESGAGKERVAQLLHRRSPVRDGSFVAVNCGALPETLLESELFGYERGAFTGAVRQRRGLFEQAQGGTLFLDEIGDMSPLMQVKLLRAIQERQITRVGAERPLSVSIRLVCATNRDLRALVERGGFREDLYYRINVIHLRVPPLRERSEDVLWLAGRFLCERAGGEAPRRLSASAQSALLRHSWPGNARELKHCIDRACILARGPLIEPWDLFQTDPEPGTEGLRPETLDTYLRACERQFIARALDEHGWRVTQTAAELGISRKNLWEKMRKLGIQGPGSD